MGFFNKLFGSKIACPECGASGARDSFSGIKCAYPRCRHFDRDYALTSGQKDRFPNEWEELEGGGLSSSKPATPSPSVSQQPPRPAQWGPIRAAEVYKGHGANRNVTFEDPLDMLYLNHRKELKIFTVSQKSMKDHGRFLTARVLPSGKSIAFRKSKIQDQDLVRKFNEACAADPDVWDAKTMRYHAKRGSTSPLYEELLQKYPHFRDGVGKWAQTPLE